MPRLDASRLFLTVAMAHGLLVGAVWIPWSLGVLRVPSAFPADAWFWHEVLFGFFPMVVTGWVLRTSPKGLLAAALLLVWLAGRATMVGLIPIPEALLAMGPAAFLVLLLGLARGHWRDWPVMILGAVFAIGFGLFHWQMWRYGTASLGLAISLAAAVAGLVSVIGILHHRSITISMGLGLLAATLALAAGTIPLRAALIALMVGGAILPAVAATGGLASRFGAPVLAAGTAALFAAAIAPAWTMPLLLFAWITWLGGFGLALAALWRTPGQA